MVKGKDENHYKHIVVSPTVFNKLTIRKGRGSFNDAIDDLLNRAAQSPREKFNNMLLDVERFLRYELPIESTIPADKVFAKVRALFIMSTDNPSVLVKLHDYILTLIDEPTPEQDAELKKVQDTINNHAE